MALKKGTPVVVKADGYVNAGAKATVAADQVEGSIWVRVDWDEPKGDRVNGEYLANSFDVVEPEKADLTAAIAELVDKTYSEAFEKGKAEGTVISNGAKDTLRNSFAELNKHSQVILDILKANDVL